MADPLPIIRMYGPEAFRSWLGDTIGSGFGHGSQLIDRLIEVGPSYDTVARADRLLTVAHDAGWLIKHKWTPTPVTAGFLRIGARAGNADLYLPKSPRLGGAERPPGGL